MKKRPSDKNKISADRAMLLDESSTPALYALIRPQERPVFQMDDKKRPFAMVSDSDDKSDKIEPKIKAKDKPLTIQESKPE
jgi:hypothetical protein